MPHGRVHELVRRHIEHRFPAQAYLLVGNDEAAKEATIRFVAEELLGTLWQHHPDMIAISPEDNRAAIALSAVRMARTKLFQKPTGNGSFLLCVIRSLDRMHHEAAAALLKILEDPPPSVVFVATSFHREAIIPTIRSRFLTLRLWDSAQVPDMDMLKRLQGLSYENRLANISALESRTAIGACVRSALWHYDQVLRTSSDVAETARTMQRLVSVGNLLQDPTASERMIGEYLMAIF